jgi:uncharacterized protein
MIWDMPKIISFLFLLIVCAAADAQPGSYVEKLQTFQQNYVATHEVVLKDDKNYFRFFPVNENYRVKATFEKLADSAGFIMKTSGAKSSRYFRYGRITFSLHDTLLQLSIFQSEDLLANAEYKDYLFLPFTDFTSGEESYGGGRYIDLRMADIKNNVIRIDFNKAYNPYCAYAAGYNCPIPPGENYLPVTIKAGEKNYAKDWH